MDTAKDKMTTMQSIDAIMAYVNDTLNRLEAAKMQLRTMMNLLQQMKQREALAKSKAAEAKAKVKKAQALTPKI